MPDKTAVDTILVGRDRAYNRIRQCLSDHWRSIGSFQQMCGHYLVEPPSIVLEPMANNERPCTPASGWEQAFVRH